MLNNSRAPSPNLCVERIIDKPLIYPEMDRDIGDNINGPSMIRAPDWLPNRLGNYYLYFAHHHGRSIRLAYADQITGPWQIHQPGALDVHDSLFESQDILISERKSLSGWANKFEDTVLHAHVASPHVLIDQNNNIIRMYYHGLMPNGDQKTRMAISDNGCTFSPVGTVLGPPYFRTFEYGSFIYAFSWGGDLWRSDDWGGLFELGPRIIVDAPDPKNYHGFRHGEVHLAGDTLTVFYSRIGDCPERIVYLTIDLDADWNKWRAGNPVDLLQPFHSWEGADLPMQSSKVGAAYRKENGLRDPCLFVDIDGTAYLLYAFAGEAGIGLVKITGLQP